MTDKIVPRPDSILAREPALRSSVEKYARASRAEATAHAHAADWTVFESWCSEHSVPALPATPDVLAAFLADEAERGKAVATVKRYTASISKWHKLKGLPSPASSPQVKTVLEGIRRTKGGGNPNAKKALTADLFPRLTAEFRTHRQAVRDRAILLLGHAAALRRSELCALDVNDLRWVDAGVILTIRKSKTDQASIGRDVLVPRLDDLPDACPVRAIRLWLDEARITVGPLFRGLRRGGGPRPTRLAAGQVAAIVKRAAVLAGLDPKEFGGHSLRAGYVTDARKIGLGWGEIMDQTGHRKVETARRYERGLPEDRLRATRADEVLRAAFGARGSSAHAWEDLTVGVRFARVGLPPPSPEVVARFREGSDEHRRLCASAAAWLEAQGLGWQVNERSYPEGGRADLASKDGKVLVEAGDTDLDRVLAALRSGLDVMLVPYGFGGVVGFRVSGTPESREAFRNAFQSKLDAASVALDDD